MKRTILGRSAIPAAVALSLSLAACGAVNEQAPAGTGSASDLSGTLAGAGASSQAAAMIAWKAGFASTHPGVTVNYDPIGSGGGREQFLAGGTAFAGTDSYLDEEELAKVPERCNGGQLIEIPNYISPIAIAYNIEGVDDLQLSPKTMASIFNGTISNWNDPAIAEDNPAADLPDLPITVVHRSDDSGTTENFVDYLSETAPKAWPHEVSDVWPVPGQEAAKGTQGVVQAIGAGNGTIGYADASQIGDLDAAKVKVGDEYVPYSPEAAAKIVDASEPVEGRPSPYDMAIDLKRDTAEAGTYPVVLVSYLLACTTYEDPNTAALVKEWLNHVVSEEGQELAAQQAGSAPLSPETMEKAQEAVNAIETE